MSFFKPTANLGAMLFDQAVVTATRSKYILDLLVVETREKNAAVEESLIDTAQRGDVNLVCHSKPLGIFVNLLEMGYCRRCLLIILCPLEEGL